MRKREKLDQVIEGFSKTNILVFGDVMMDRFIWGNVSRISPEAPVPVVKVERETFLLGGAANVVHNIQALEGTYRSAEFVGDDEMGRRIIRDLKKIGMGTQGLFVDPGRQTTVKTRIIAHHQQVVRIDRETSDAIRPSTLQALSEFLKKVGRVRRGDSLRL